MDINIVMIEEVFYRSCRYLRLLKYALYWLNDDDTCENTTRALSIHTNVKLVLDHRQCAHITIR